MILRNAAWKKASLTASKHIQRDPKCTKSTLVGQTSNGIRPNVGEQTATGGISTPSLDLKHFFTSSSEAEKHKKSLDRDFFVSVLESSATKRDAKAYLQTFGPKTARPKGKAADPEILSGPGATKKTTSTAATPGLDIVRDSSKHAAPVQTVQAIAEDIPHAAVVKLRNPQDIDDATLSGIAKTLSQLRTLGLMSFVVVDCGASELKASGWQQLLRKQLDRTAQAVDKFGKPGARIVDSAIAFNRQADAAVTPPFASSCVFIENDEAILAPMRLGSLILIPACAISLDTLRVAPVESNDAAIALTRYLSGLQFSGPSSGDVDSNADMIRPVKLAHVDRVIILDPLGGTPSTQRENGVHVFLNLADEFESTCSHLDKSGREGIPNSSISHILEQEQHRSNLELAQSALSFLPSTSSAIITSPTEAANLPSHDEPKSPATGFAGFVDVGTRRRKNPLIHNLLTDRPVYSSSLPMGRIKTTPRGSDLLMPSSSTTTLAKRGMPVTVFPDPKSAPWLPPKPGTPRLRLTDTCIDMPRLVNLIEDSFNRKLDVRHYLDRVNESLAGIIIAGEYEGGAILTWERPFGLDEETAYRQGRMVPYLDKFAVLKKSQGAGGVADIVFNSMVRDCFPDGVCWRSRMNNPVNKWYFERSRATWKLNGSNWAMFWTTPDLALDNKRVRDYENVCRNVAPSWADMKHIVD